jgi:hypothetical protein
MIFFSTYGIFRGPKKPLFLFVTIFIRSTGVLPDRAWNFELWAEMPIIPLFSLTQFVSTVPSGLCSHYTSEGAAIWITGIYAQFFPTSKFLSLTSPFEHNPYCLSYILFINRSCLGNGIPVSIKDTLLVVGKVYLNVSLIDIMIRTEWASVCYREILFNTTEFARIDLRLRSFFFYILVRLSAHNVNAVQFNLENNVYCFSSMHFIIDYNAAVNDPLLIKLVERLNAVTAENLLH